MHPEHPPRCGHTLSRPLTLIAGLPYPKFLLLIKQERVYITKGPTNGPSDQQTKSPIYHFLPLKKEELKEEIDMKVTTKFQINPSTNG